MSLVSKVVCPIRLGLIMALSRLAYARPSSYHALPDSCQATLAKPAGFGETSRSLQVPQGDAMAGYKLATYQSADGPRAGVVIDDKLFDAAKLTRNAAYATVLAILEDWKNAQAVLKKAAAGAAKAKGGKGGGQPLKGAKLLAPLRWPSAIYCAGANYADHAAEMN